MRRRSTGHAAQRLGPAENQRPEPPTSPGRSMETRRRFRGLLEGLLAELPRKNCWTIAEHAGDSDPYGMQYLLGRAVWDADQVRDDLRGYVTEHLGSAGAVLVVDETGDLKKGTSSV